MPSSRPRRLTLLCLALLLCAGARRPARADRKEEAAGAADRGDRALGKGAFAEALAEYQASFEQYPKPFLLPKIAECERRLGRDADALATYERYVAKATHGAARKKADRAIAELRAKLAAQAPEPAPPPSAPVAQSTDAEAPPMREGEVAAARGKKVKTGPSLTTATAPQEEPRPPGFDPNAPSSPSSHEADDPAARPLYKRWWIWTLAGGVVVVGVALGVGLALGLPRFSSELPVGGPGAAALSVRF